MDLAQHLRDLFSYDGWANHEVLKALEASKRPTERSLKLLAHILSAERLWLERLQSQKQTQPVWPPFSMEDSKLEVAELVKRWKGYLASADEAALSESIAYKNTKGESFSSRKSDVLMHVVMHSAYHRGQIAADMRAAGIVPASTDFIHAVRQGFLR